MNYVYHSSKEQGLTFIEPRPSTHGEAWVYAMRSPELCAMYLGEHSDLVVQTSVTDEGQAIVVERLAGALEMAYGGKQGSIYALEARGFEAGRTSFEPELVSEEACPVIAEERIDDALKHLLDLERSGTVTVYRYPDLPAWMPRDKGDLIRKVVVWARRPGSAVLEAVAELHPDILEEVRRRLHEPDASAGR